MIKFFKRNWGLIGCFLVAAAILGSYGTAHAQSRDSYTYSLNGRDYATNPNMLSGPGGCRSNLLNVETGRLVCPADGTASWRSLLQLEVARECGMTRPDWQQGLAESSCIGGFVAVGRECPRLPHTCRYFRIVDSYDVRERWTVSVTRIHELGNQLWVARPRGTHWSLFGRCHADQYSRYPHRYSC